MTVGQMKQVIRRLDGSVPTNLTHSEADFFTRSDQVGGELDVFWFRIRNMPKQQMSIYPVYVDGLVVETIKNHHIEFAGDGNNEERELESLAQKFPATNPRLEALEIREIRGKFDSVVAVREDLNQQGYTSASFDELIAFATQHSDYFARIGSAYVHILQETDTGRFPLVWSDNSSTGYAHLQLYFDDWRTGLSNQMSASSISVLAKKL